MKKNKIKPTTDDPSPDYESAIRQLMDQISRRNTRLEWFKDEQKRLIQEVSEKERFVQAITAHLAEKERSDQILTTQVQALSAQVQAITLHAQGLSTHVTEKEQAVRALTAQVQAITLHAQGLSIQADEKEKFLQVLSAQVAQKEQSVQVLSSKLIEIDRSKAWKMAMFFRRIRILLFPPNSHRARLPRR